METKEVGQTVQKGLMSLLSNRPVWVFWIAYSALSGIIFGVFYAAMYLMALQWWMPIIAIIAVGVIWGSISHGRNARDSGNERTSDKKEA
jgi:hypothetical protein